MSGVLVSIRSPMLAFLMPAMPVIGERTFVQPVLSWASPSAARSRSMSACVLDTPAWVFDRLARAAFTEAWFAESVCTALSTSCWVTAPLPARGA